MPRLRLPIAMLAIYLAAVSGRTRRSTLRFRPLDRWMGWV